jgi:hypothetical protein
MAEDDHRETKQRASGTTLAWAAAISFLVLFAVAGGVLALVKLTRVRDSSRTAHMRQFIMFVRLEEEAYRAETEHYASLSSDLSDLCPRGATVTRPVAWQGDCGGGKDGLNASLAHVAAEDGPFEFGIAAVAGRKDTRAPSLPAPFPPAEPPAGNEWYVIYAAQPHGGADRRLDRAVGVSYSRDLTVIEDY